MSACAMSDSDSDEESRQSENDDSPIWEEIPNNIIVFISKADSEEGELYLRDKNGLIKRLTTNDRHENNPALSPDKTKVAFHAGKSNDPLTWEIYVLDIASGKEERLTYNNVLDAHPDWSPDGNKIIYCSFQDISGKPSSTSDLFVIDSNGMNPLRLTSCVWDNSDAEYSPDGSLIVFKSTRNTRKHAREEIYVMDSDGSNVKRLTTTSGWESDHDPSWSPDGQTIVFNRYEGIRQWFDIVNPDIVVAHWRELIPWSICTVDLSENMTKLYEPEHTAGLPLFSSDGKYIVFLKMDFIFYKDIIGATHRLFVMKTDKSSMDQLIPDDIHTSTLEYYDW